MKTFLAASALVAVAYACGESRSLSSEDGLRSYSFEQFVKDFNKNYDGEEYERRHAVFTLRKSEAITHNMQNPEYELGVTKFMDQTDAEFKATLGYKRISKAGLTGSPGDVCTMDQAEGPIDNFPASLDWRAKGVVSPVKDQGQCGSCWAFATTETVESRYAVATGDLKVLSPQNVVSCVQNPYNCGGSGGCNGATSELGFEYVAKNGIALNSAWTYSATNGQCTPHTPVVGGGGCTRVKENSYNATMAAIQDGPVAVSVDATYWSMYSGGIFNRCASQATLEINHAVQLVGYGSENGKDYWIVRNSWGAGWGESGYIRLPRGPSVETCKQDTSASSGSACSGDPETITTCGSCGIWYDNSYPEGLRTL